MVYITTSFVNTNQLVNGAGFISNVVEDTTPQLGGNLDLNSSDITGTGNINVTGNLSANGISTLSNVVVGGVTTELVVVGDTRITGILTVGNSSLTLDGNNDLVNVGTLTLGHTQGIQFHTQNLHAQGFEVNNVNASGIVTTCIFRYFW